MGFRDVAVHVEVACYGRDCEFHAFELSGQDYLAAQSGRWFQTGRHVQHVVFLLQRFLQLVVILVADVDLAGRAR